MILPVLGFVAPSGTGKTTLLRQVVPILKARGLRIGYLKHAHHRFDLDRPGKDSFEVRAAGAACTLLASSARWALQAECRAEDADPDLGAMLARFPTGTVDLILVEGFKHACYPKIEVYRAAVGEPPLYPLDPDIVAVATDARLADDGHPPVLPLGDPEAVAAFILGRLDGAGDWGPDPRSGLLRCVRRLRRADDRHGDPDSDWGSASLRLGDWLYATPARAAPEDPTAETLIHCPRDGPPVPAATADLPLHRAVYRAQPAARALLHSRGVWSVGVTLDGRPFAPPDSPGRELLGTVPVLSIPDELLPTAAPGLVAATLARHPIAVVRGLGVYAWAADPESACRLVRALERSARIWAIARQAGTI